MEFQKRDIAFLFLIATVVALSPARSLASQDCRSEAKDAIEDCNTIAQSAEQANSDAASGMAGNPANMNQGGAGLSSVSDWGRGNLQGASAQCKTDLQKCLDECNQALAAAKDPSIQSSIKKNAQYCNDSISKNEDKLATAQSQLASASQGGKSTALSSGDSKYDDSVIASEKAAQNPDAQQVGMDNLGAARLAGQKFGAGTTGSGGNEAIFGSGDRIIRIPIGPGDAARPYTGPSF